MSTRMTLAMATVTVSVLLGAGQAHADWRSYNTCNADFAVGGGKMCTGIAASCGSGLHDTMRCYVSTGEIAPPPALGLTIDKIALDDHARAYALATDGNLYIETWAGTHHWEFLVRPPAPRGCLAQRLAVVDTATHHSGFPPLAVLYDCGKSDRVAQIHLDSGWTSFGGILDISAGPSGDLNFYALSSTHQMVLLDSVTEQYTSSFEITVDRTLGNSSGIYYNVPAAAVLNGGPVFSVDGQAFHCSLVPDEKTWWTTSFVGIITPYFASWIFSPFMEPSIQDCGLQLHGQFARTPRPIKLESGGRGPHSSGMTDRFWYQLDTTQIYAWQDQ